MKAHFLYTAPLSWLFIGKKEETLRFVPFPSRDQKQNKTKTKPKQNQGMEDRGHLEEKSGLIQTRI